MANTLYDPQECMDKLKPALEQGEFVTGESSAKFNADATDIAEVFGSRSFSKMMEDLCEVNNSITKMLKELLGESNDNKEDATAYGMWKVAERMAAAFD